jgi:hypothetical protein
VTIESIDYDVEIAVYELTLLVADFCIGLFVPLLLDKGNRLLNHPYSLVFRGPLSCK